MTLTKLDEYRKAVVAFLIAAFALLAFFVTFDPGIQLAAIALTGAVFNVVGVFLAKNHTLDDVSKALTALQASTIALVGFWVTVDPSTTESVAAIIAAVVNVYGVWRVTNAPPSR